MWQCHVIMQKLDGPRLNEGGIAERIQELLRDVNALAGQLRKPAAVTGGEDNVPAGVRGILQVLEELGPQTVPGIARVRGHSRQSVQMLVNRLEGLGWVELMSNPAHRRSALVCLTARGRVLLAKATAAEMAVLESRLSGISERGVNRASALLRQIRCALTGKELALEEPVPRRKDGKRAVAVAQPAGEETERVAAPEAQARQRGAAATLETTAVPEASQPEPEEFPVNLL